MSIAIIGDVAESTNDILLPSVAGRSAGEGLTLTSAAGTEIVVVRSVGVGRSNVGQLTLLRGALGTAVLTHTSPTTVAVYDPNGTGGGGGVTVTVPPAAAVPVTNITAPGAVIADGSADLSGVLLFRKIGPYRVAFGDTNIQTVGAVIAEDDIPAGADIVKVWATPVTEWVATGDIHPFLMYIVLLPNTAYGAGSPGAAGDIIAELGDLGENQAHIGRRSYPVMYGSEGNGERVGNASVSSGFAVTIVDNNGDPNLTAGSADIYAILATPAS